MTSNGYLAVSLLPEPEEEFKTGHRGRARHRADDARLIGPSQSLPIRPESFSGEPGCL